MKSTEKSPLIGEHRPEESLNQLRSICDTMPGLIYQVKVEPEGAPVFTFVSTGVQEILGIKPYEIYSDAKAGFSMVHPDDLKTVMKSNFFSAETLQQRSFVFRIKDNNTSEYKWVRANSKPMRLDDGSIVWNGLMIDVTMDKESEEDRIAIAEEVNRELESFSYTVSHDLQTPLRSIAGFSKILLTEHKNELSTEIKGYLEIIESNARRMSDLTKNLLNFSRLGKAAICCTEIDMNALVRETLDDLAELHANREVKITTHNLMPAMGDARLIKQVWFNVVSNALKYSAKKDVPVIEIGMAGSNNELVYFVKDNGAGFDMKHADKLFAPFHRIHSQQEFEGSGIGLATVHRVITKHGGKVWAEAEPGDGACFYFSLAVFEG